MDGIQYYPKFSKATFTPNDIPWRMPQVRFDPKTNRMLQGRPSQGYGSEPFAYAGKHMDPLPWEANDKINSLRKGLESFFHVEFYFCLCGLYEDNTVAIPEHRDEIDRDDDIIVSLSYGATRLFQVQGPGNVVENYIVEDGDMIVMDGRSQGISTHSVPAIAHATGPRVNLTFRTKG